MRSSDAFDLESYDTAQPRVFLPPLEFYRHSEKPDLGTLINQGGIFSFTLWDLVFWNKNAA